MGGSSHVTCYGNVESVLFWTSNLFLTVQWKLAMIPKKISFLRKSKRCGIATNTSNNNEWQLGHCTNTNILLILIFLRDPSWFQQNPSWFQHSLWKTNAIFCFPLTDGEPPVARRTVKLSVATIQRGVFISVSILAVFGMVLAVTFLAFNLFYRKRKYAAWLSSL